MTAPAVFVSYSHDSQEHKHWVLNLATRLRQSGVDSILDQWDLGPGGDLPHFMEHGIARSTRIVMVCTERYVEKANAGVGGVGYEKMIVTADLLEKIGSSRVIPVIRQAATLARLPTFLGSKLYIDLSSDDRYETGFDQLLRELLNAPLFIKPPIGSDPFKPVEGAAKPTGLKPVDQFMQAIASIYDNSGDDGILRTEWARAAMPTSKVLFHYAMDQAEASKYIRSGGSRDFFWVLEAGRAYIVERLVSERGAA